MSSGRHEPRATSFALKGNYLSAGRVNISVAQGNVLAVSLKVNAEGGENAIHAHQGEEHAFIVLEGEVTFFDEDAIGTVLRSYEGIFLPEGVSYRYLNTGGTNLFMLRIGATTDGGAPYGARVDASGEVAPAQSAENHHRVGVLIPGKTWGAQ